MNIDAHVLNELCGLVQRTAGALHREEYFTSRLTARLWPHLGERILGTTGLYVNVLEQVIRGSPADALRMQYLPKTKDFYADLMVLDDLAGTRLRSSLTIDAVLEQVGITHLYEFKYLTSFPTMEPRHAKADTCKLVVLGEFVHAVTGVRPCLHQFVVATNRVAKKTRTVQNLLGWFSEDMVRGAWRNVCIEVVDPDGNCHRR